MILLIFLCVCIKKGYTFSIIGNKFCMKGYGNCAKRYRDLDDIRQSNREVAKRKSSKLGDAQRF